MTIPKVRIEVEMSTIEGNINMTPITNQDGKSFTRPKKRKKQIHAMTGATQVLSKDLMPWRKVIFVVFFDRDLHGVDYYGSK